MRWYNSIKVKLIGFFMVISFMFMVTMFSVLTMLKKESLTENASKEINLATIKILNNLQNTKYRLEEIVLALASVGEGASGENITKTTISRILKANNSDLVTSGGIFLEPFQVNKDIKNYTCFFNKTKGRKFTLLEDYVEDSHIIYSKQEFYVVAKRLKKGKTYWTKVYRDPVTNVRMTTVVSPIYKSGKVIGVASLDIRVKDTSSKIFGDFKYNNRYLMMLDREGTFILKSSLLSKYLIEHNKLTQKCDELTDEFKEFEPIFKKIDYFRDYNNSISTQLFKSSPDISKDESLRVAEIINQENSGKNLDIKRDIFFIDYDPILKDESIVAVFSFPTTHWKVIIGIPKEQVLKESNKMYNEIIKASIYLALFATLIGYFLLRRLFIDPIESINEQLSSHRIRKDTHYKLLECKDKGEIGLLVSNLNMRTKDLMLSENREAEEIKKRLINEKLLEQQSKMAAMGGMMDAVAHQWKQPLNALSMYSQIIKSDFEDGDVDQKYIDDFRDNIQLQISHMLSTLDEFRNFFRPCKVEEDFELLDVVNSVLFLTKDEFMKNSINVTILEKDRIKLFGFKNEFKHLILNIINNAKDAFNENEIKNRTITFSLINRDNKIKLEIQDNAGGIPEEVINDIFKANVTTKVEGKGTGIGLFMSMQIANKQGADLYVKNQNSGACFVVDFKGSVE
jgi:signal transduction histidine kinase